MRLSVIWRNNMKKITKSKIIIVFSFIFTVILLIFLYIDHRNSGDPGYILENMYNLPTSYTMEEAIKDDFIDVTQVLPEKSDVIENFMHSYPNNDIAFLRTARKVDSDFTVDLLVSYKQQPYFTLYSYLIKGQSCIVRYFAKEFQIEKNNNKINVMLKSMPNPTKNNIINTSEVNSDFLSSSFLENDNTIDTSKLKADFLFYSYIEK